MRIAEAAVIFLSVATVASVTADGPSAGVLAAKPIAAHHFSPRHAIVRWAVEPSPAVVAQERPVGGRRLSSKEDSSLSVFHISDAHISLVDEDPPRTSRMFHAFAITTDKVAQEPTTSSNEFVRLLRMACAQQVDIIALGGDIVNFPSKTTVDWVLEQLRGPGCGIPFIYTAGNHDWHEEGRPWELRYDAQREPELGTTLRPLFEQSLMGSRLFGHIKVKDVDVLFFDNSNHQINEKQFSFAENFFRTGRASAAPVLILLHMPLALRGMALPPKLCCGHPQWGAAVDDLYQTEGRARWPEEGNLPSTRAFIDLVQAHSAPAGRIVALLTGHVHRDFSVDVREKHALTPRSADNLTAPSCDLQQPGCGLRPGSSTVLLEVGAALGDPEPAQFMEADGAVQYTTLDAAEGGYRLLTVLTGDADVAQAAALKSARTGSRLPPGRAT